MRYDFNGHKFNFLHPANTNKIEEYISYLLLEHDYRKRFWDINEGDTVIDVGVDYGSYTLTALAMGAHVIAIEPRLESVNNLKRNVSMNPGFDDRLEIIQIALDAKAGAMCLTAGQGRSSTNTENCDSNNTITQRLDDLDITDYVSWIKIDTEGSELRILQGAESIIQMNKPTMIVECHLMYDKTMDKKVVAYLRELNPTYEFQVTSDLLGMVVGYKHVLAY